ncbi:MAG: polyphosphate kinase 1 [Ezakiella sp.]|nr:polyphosphate kinase 1 [Ezakiella sp.]
MEEIGQDVVDNKLQLEKEEIYNIAQNRELSWLKFNQRVLHEAVDKSVPLYEKLKFISIFVSNMKEFFMVRVGSLEDLLLVNEPAIDNKTGMSVNEQLMAIFKETRSLYKEKDSIYLSVEHGFREEGIFCVDIDELVDADKRILETIFRHQIEPILSPMVIDKYHPFPFLENTELYLCAELKLDDKDMTGIVQVPKMLPPYFKLPGENLRYILTEKIIEYFLPEIYKQYKINFRCVISATRNADISIESEMLEDDEDDYRNLMRKALKKRQRLQCVRLTTSLELPSKIKKFLMKHLNILDEQIFVTTTPLNMKYVFKLEGDIPEKILKQISYEPFKPQRNPDFKKDMPLMRQVEERDFLLIYPFEDMGHYIELLEEAANDPDVVSIKITIYRLAKNSKVVQALMKAAENGKEVLALMELRARFDEQNNIDYTDELYNAGCKIIYGIEEYKVHSKVTLITYKKSGGLSYITQIGTGNYNESTSKQYTDASFITSDQVIGEDAAKFFQKMTLGELDGEYNKLIQAPSTFKSSLMNLIDEEIKKGNEGRIFFKFNSFTDKDFILKLAEASQAGVKIRLNIRGICCLIPGIKGLTENIEVRSIVGRYLEHTRVYKFGEGEDSIIYIGSADLMTRNTMRRVEVACPIEAPYLKEKINSYLNYIWKDNLKARRLQIDGNYGFIHFDNTEEPFCAQDAEMLRAIENANKRQEVKEDKSFINKITNWFKNTFK